MLPIDWHPPEDWLALTTIDAHTGGEPFRVVVGGIPEIRGATMLERRRYAMEHLDFYRRALMWEPRGHADMYGCFVVPPLTPGAHLGVLFLHNEGFSTMCGHGVIALTRVAVETGMLGSAAVGGSDGEITVKIDSPAGLVVARARKAGGEEGSEAGAVRFLNVPSFVVELDGEVEVPGLGRLRYDLAFGGAFYAYVRAEEIGLTLSPSRFREILERGRQIKQAVQASRTIVHPLEEDLGFLYGVIFVEASPEDGVHSRNVCVFADGEVDRSPTGTGVSGRLAIHHARGEIEVGERITIESLVGSRFTGQVVETAACGPYAAVIPEVAASAHITGRHEFLIDPADPLRAGFLLR